MFHHCTGPVQQGDGGGGVHCPVTVFTPGMDATARGASGGKAGAEQGTTGLDGADGVLGTPSEFTAVTENMYGVPGTREATPTEDVGAWTVVFAPVLVPLKVVTT
jgi:hypothetical protein